MKKLQATIVFLLLVNISNAQSEFTAEYFGDLGELKWAIKYTSDSLMLIYPHDNIQRASTSYNRAKIYISTYEPGIQIVDIIFEGDSMPVHIQYTFTDFLLGNKYRNIDIDFYAGVVIGAYPEIWNESNRGTIFETMMNSSNGIYKSITVWRLVHPYKYRFDNLVLEDDTFNSKDELNAAINTAYKQAIIKFNNP